MELKTQRHVMNFSGVGLSQVHFFSFTINAMNKANYRKLKIHGIVAF